MQATKCVGLLGGLGVGAAVHYYEQLERMARAQQRDLDLVMVNVDMEPSIGYMEAGDRAGFAAYLAPKIARLKAAGAEMAVIPSVTANSCSRVLAATSPLPIVDIYQPVARELALRGWKRVALFGTKFVVQSGMFCFVTGAEFVLPQRDEVAQIHETYLAIARASHGTPEQHEFLTALAHRLIAREKLDAVLLAGTDLSLLFNESNTDFPNLDCARLHIREVLRLALG